MSIHRIALCELSNLSGYKENNKSVQRVYNAYLQTFFNSNATHLLKVFSITLSSHKEEG